jgi:hypothetical protein
VAVPVSATGRLRDAATLLLGTCTPVLVALGAGAAFARTPGSFSRPAAMLAGSLGAAACAGALLVRRPAWPRPARPATAAPAVDLAGTVPAPGTVVTVHTHFTTVGGYVHHDGLLLWAEPDAAELDGGVRHTPGARCTVTRVTTVGDAVRLTVGAAR